MSQKLAIIPVKFIYALIVGITHRTGLPQSPFTKGAGGITCFFEEVKKRKCAGR
ncbi:hypothetical protein SDC9_129790 [bioreactor metagenome]|uniref:Uncharacterized protein n=1 Tax=bioreactor metagenome TaxID=1076179 RepID=A0A645D0T9_9ZZZZ